MTTVYDRIPFGASEELSGNERTVKEQRLALTWLHRLLAVGCFDTGKDWHDFLLSLYYGFGMKDDCLADLPEAERSSRRGLGLIAAAVANHAKNLPAGGDSRTLEKIQTIADAVSLSAVDHQILQLMVLIKMDAGFASVLERMRVDPERVRFHRHRVALCAMLGITFDQGEACLSSKGALIRYGFLIADDEGDLTLSTSIFRFIRHASEETSFIDHVVGAPKKAVCSAEDFKHLGQAPTHIASLLASAVAQKAKGINIFIYGPSGSGKTELASVLANSIGCSLYGICDSPENGEAPHRAERIQSMILCQHMLLERGHTLLVMDEADDVLSENWSFLKMLKQTATSSYSKIFLTRMLEENVLPVIWIVNSIDSVDPALLRRMSYALKVPVPSKEVRARIWDKALCKSGIEATAIEVNRLAADLESGPAVAATSIRVSKMQGGGFAAVERTARSIASAMQGGRPILTKTDDADFDVQLVCGGQDFETLHQRASEWRESPTSFCISGPSGTGKSLALRALAKRMKREVMVCRASNLLGKYVGETEANIADAFSRAESDGLFLIIDEAETLLGDRRHAGQNWEASMTAEFLTWMERHLIPFGVTTNHVDLIDPAMLRRFTFKLSFKAMSTQQRNQAYERFFGVKAPAGLLNLHGLTAADFAVTAKRAQLMGFADNAAQCLNALGEELDAKTSKSRAVGFLTPLSRSAVQMDHDIRRREAH